MVFWFVTPYSLVCGCKCCSGKRYASIFRIQWAKLIEGQSMWMVRGKWVKSRSTRGVTRLRCEWGRADVKLPSQHLACNGWRLWTQIQSWDFCDVNNCAKHITIVLSKREKVITMPSQPCFKILSNETC